MNSRPLLLVLAVIFAQFSASAESTYEREMNLLRAQRDKAVAESTKALNARYQQALEAVYRRAVQAKDPTAANLKTELESLGPLRVQDVTPSAATSSKAAILPRSMVGAWAVVHIGAHRETWEFKEDGTCAITPGTAKVPSRFGTWAKEKDTIEVRFENGNVTALRLPIKNGKLEGTTHSGSALWLTKK